MDFIELFINNKMFVYIDGQQFVIIDEAIKSGDFFIDTRDESYAQCDYVTKDSVVNNCICGQCTIEDRTAPKEVCRKIIPVDIRYN